MPKSISEIFDLKAELIVWCPWCHSEAGDPEKIGDEKGKEIWIVACNRCGAQGPYGSSAKTAQAKWNKLLG